MFIWFSSLILLVSTSFAEVGKIHRVVGHSDAYLMRGNQKVTLADELVLEENDELFSEASAVILHLYPLSQISLSKNSQIKITKNVIEESEEKDKAVSIIGFIKGLIRLQVSKDPEIEVEQKVE